jgi:hypothetical protein
VRYLILFAFYFFSQHITFRPNSPKELETHPVDTENKGRTPRVTKDNVEELAQEIKYIIYTLKQVTTI